ncbi:putative LPS assembly protein LptD [Algoriphagus sediminis]|uniref:LPS assembly protein LptD n=1 Tax=Algoriphagus sediminis TaxID=3057113 RepID=A0ABT7Y826_9BACT|nr:putative LPS assembly protein LptD [Algoriphagus sediminis]MDN3202671.1 putative LPS assembly protein LptD [Algoriphagus sediminis]
MQSSKFIFFFLLLGLLTAPKAFSQESSPPVKERILVAPDTLESSNPPVISSDTLNIPADTLSTDSVANIMPTSPIMTDIVYFAEDSIVSDFVNNKVYLYKEAWFEYGEMRLDAERIIIDMNTNEVYASGVTDSLGNVTGNPFFKDGETVYEIRKEMRYNFQTQKAIIKDVVTEQQDGILRGETIKKTSSGDIYLSHGYYTTCKLTTPHWHISANKIKSVSNGQVVTGPFNMYFNGIPTPLGLPFGILPNTPEEKASGIIFPSYGNEQVRGLFLRNLGYYFAINDYVHARVTGDIYSNGGWGLKSQAVYKKRYRFNGGFDIDFQKFKSPETELNPVDYNTFKIAWRHTPESRGNSRFSASVNAGTTSYFNNIISQNNFQNNVTSDFNSNISYSKTFANTPFSLSANLRHSQSVQTGEVRIDLPTIALNMNRQSPFKNVNFEPLKTLNLAYNFNLQNTITNRVQQEFGVSSDLIQDAGDPDIIPFTLANLGLLFENARNGARHAIPISSNFRLFKHFTGTASANYNELWYNKRINYYYNPAQERVDRIIEDGFNRVAFFNTSFNLNTNIYGFFNFKGDGKIQTIRQHIQPSIGFNFTPDFSDPSFGYYQEVQVDNEGNSRLFSRHQGFIFGGAPLGESRAMSFNIRSVVEAKIRNKSDTAETETKKIPLLETLNFNTSYNFAADSFQLAPFNISARTSFFNRKLSVALSTNIDPYATADFVNGEQVTTRRINSFAWKNGQGIGIIRSASMNMNVSFNPNSAATPGEVRDEVTDNFLQNGGVMNEFVESEINRIVSDPSQYIDWNIPWNLNMGYNLAYRKAVNGTTNVTQALNISGDVSISEKWKINFNTGFDIQAQEITQSMIGIARDLHCWQMNVNWVPFGRFTSYNIDIRVKSSILQDLKVSRRRSFFDL